MKTIKIDLPQNLNRVEIHIFSDWHIGDNACDLANIKKQIATVQNNPNAYVICNGDLMNNATKTSVSDCYAEKIPPMEQLQTVCELLEPIKDRILIFDQGNHEARTYRNDGIDLTAVLAQQLGLFDRYAREGGVVFLRFGKSNTSRSGKLCYTIYCTHGSGGGRKEGAKAIRLADMAAIIDADIYVHSHTHLPMTLKENFYRIDTRSSTISEVTKLFVNSSAQLRYGGYGQTGEFKPSSIDSPVIYLSGTKKKYSAEL